MTSYALWPYQHPSSFPTIHQRSPGEPTGHLHGRIYRRHPNLFGLHRPALGPRMRSTQMPSGSWTICKPQEVQLPHRYHRVPRVHTDSNRTPHGPSVGGITVCYWTHLHIPVLWVRSYHQDCIIFGFSFYIQNSAKILVELEIWIFKSDASLIVDIFLNQDYSGDSNGGICVIIPALGDENRDLPCFCLPTLPRKSPWGLGSYYTPLERYS